jgi:chromosome segregation ATPase
MEFTMAAVAFFISCLSLILAAVAYWRSGGQRDVESLRQELRREIESLRERQHLLADQLAQRLRAGYEQSQAHINRLQSRLAEARREATAEVVARIDALSRRLSELAKKADDGLERLKHEVTREMQSAEAGLEREIRRLEADAQILIVRSQMMKAERHAKKGEFSEAEKLLENAVTKTNQIRTVVAGDAVEERALDEVNDALVEAIRRVRSKAESFRREIERVVATSESLLTSLQARERKAA